MNNNLFNALEICLQALENGETLDSALTRFPALAADLRPMLEASLHARTLAGPQPSDAILRRGRTRLLQQAAKMRDAKRAPRRTWLYNFRPLAVTFMLIVLFLSGTGLVRASTTSLPGDNLYPVKRTWEDMRLLFTFADDDRVSLELEYESERLEEISELLTEGRVEPITFSGYVTSQSDGQWVISGIPANISEQTKLPNEPIKVGSVVTVYGITTLDGHVQAQSVDVVPAGTPIPTPKPEEEENDGDDDEEEESESRGGGVSVIPPQQTETAPPSETETGGSSEESGSGEKSKFEGVVESMNGTMWIVNGRVVDVSGAEIIGTPVPGASVAIEGYIDEHGVFIATKIIVGSSAGISGTETPEDDTEQTPESTETEPPEEEED